MSRIFFRIKEKNLFNQMTKEDKTLEILAHILGILTGFIGPLIIFLSSENKKVKQHAKNSLNWQISFIIYMFVSMILIFILIGILTAFALVIINLTFSIIAAIRAGEGKIWKYPFTINFVR